ncbi:MAG TPA: GNAT family N-acetyltransferase [Solirubrobacteraceae bacterium]|nr:GNAT family N-acetyltransferase [Solirubrobacteraceae bacterium]
MTPADVAAAEAVGRGVLSGGADPGDDALAERGRRRVAHLQRTDPGGAWVAEHDGRVVGLALALVREGVWGLSLFAVAPAHQCRGVGRRLLEAAFDHGRDARGHLILSTGHPAAMRRYARLGLELRPCVAAAGIVDPVRRPAVDGVREAGAEGVATADAIGRAVRGAGHGPDLPVLLEAADTRLLLAGDRAFAVVRDDRIALLAGRDEDAATRVLDAALATSRPGATITVEFLTAGQDWAVRACLDAGLALSPDGPLFAGGDIGPLRPYLPSGAYL